MTAVLKGVKEPLPLAGLSIQVRSFLLMVPLSHWRQAKPKLNPRSNVVLNTSSFMYTALLSRVEGCGFKQGHVAMLC
jgi:hypothetical protein